MKDRYPDSITDDRLHELFDSLPDAPLPHGIEARIMEAVQVRRAEIEEKRKERKWLLLTVSLALVIITAGIFAILTIYPDLKAVSFELPGVEVPQGFMTDLISVLVSYLPFGIAISIVFMLDGLIRRKYLKRRSSAEHHPATGS